jgi:hypothetical protein
MRYANFLFVAVQLWSTSNYKWFLKHTIHAVDEKTRLLDLRWDAEQPLLLHLLTLGE